MKLTEAQLRKIIRKMYSSNLREQFAPTGDRYEVDGKAYDDLKDAKSAADKAESEVIDTMANDKVVYTAESQLEEIRLRKRRMLNEQNVSQGLIEQLVAAMDAIYEDIQMQLEYDEGAYEEGQEAEAMTAQIIKDEVDGFMETIGESLQGSL